LRLSLFVGLAATALFACAAEPLVALIFQRGHFDALATQETSRALIAQGAGIWAVASTRQLVTLYYAVGDTRTPVLVSALDLIVFISLALGLSGSMGHVGVSIAVAGSSIAQATLLLVLMRRHLPLSSLAPLLPSLTKTGLALVPATALGYWLGHSLLQANIGTLLPGLVASTVFGVVFLATAKLVGSDELSSLSEPILRRLRRR
jgi:putative peptidoglycan lipid II flippase